MSEEGTFVEGENGSATNGELFTASSITLDELGQLIRPIAEAGRCVRDVLPDVGGATGHDPENDTDPTPVQGSDDVGDAAVP